LGIVEVELKQLKKMRTSVIVQNLKCGGCAKTITTKLSTIPSISDINVDTASATVSFYCDHIDDALMVKDKLKAIGYPSITAENSVFSKAKSFVSCATGKISK